VSQTITQRWARNQLARTSTLSCPRMASAVRAVVALSRVRKMYVLSASTSILLSADRHGRPAGWSARYGNTTLGYGFGRTEGTGRTDRT